MIMVSAERERGRHGKATSPTPRRDIRLSRDADTIRGCTEAEKRHSCPTCQAERGQPCHDGGEIYHWTHDARVASRRRELGLP